MHRRTLLVVCLVVLAGCSGLLGGSDGDETTSPAATPTEAVPTETPTRTAFPPPTTVEDPVTTVAVSPTPTPGGNGTPVGNGTPTGDVRPAWEDETGLNVTLLRTAHLGRLQAAGGYAFQSATVADGALNRTVDAQVDFDGPRYLVRSAETGPNGTDTTVVTYANGSTLYRKFARPSGTDYRVRGVGPDRVRSTALNLSVEETPLDTLAAVEFDEDAVASNGTYRYSAVAIEDDPRLVGNVTDFRNGTLVVGEDGVVQRYELRYRAVVDGREREVRVTYRTTGVGTTAVTEPAWVSEASG